MRNVGEEEVEEDAIEEISEKDFTR